jgi:hypothetical protein
MVFQVVQLDRRFPVVQADQEIPLLHVPLEDRPAHHTLATLAPQADQAGMSMVVQEALVILEGQECQGDR